MEPPSLRCLLCDAFIFFWEGGEQRFERHMRGEHEVAGGQMDFLLSMHFTDEGEREVLTKAMKDRYEEFSATVRVFTSGLFAPKLQNETKDDVSREDQQIDQEPTPDEEIIEVEDELAEQTDPMEVPTENEETADVLQEVEISKDAMDKKSSEPSPVLCVLCYQVQASDDVLKTHQEGEHSGDLGWVGREIGEQDLLHNCGLCSLPFVSWACLKLHFQQQHDQEKPFSEKEEETMLVPDHQLNQAQWRKSSRKVLPRTVKDSPQGRAGAKKNYKRIPIDQKQNAAQIPTDIYADCIEEKAEGPTTTNPEVNNAKTKFETNPGSGSYCVLCRKQFKYACLLATHKKKWHKDEMELFQDKRSSFYPQFSCHICAELFLTENILKFHTRSNHTREEKIAAVKKGWVESKSNSSYCSLCRKQFKFACLLVTHKNKWHKNEMGLFDEQLRTTMDPQFSCGICSESFITQNILTYHMRRQHSKEERRKPRKCSQCNEEFVWTFNRERKMKFHVRKVHKEGKRERTLKPEFISSPSDCFCKLCRKQFQYAFQFAKHKKNWHSNEIDLFNLDTSSLECRFNCDVCAESFATQNILNYHTRTKHTKDLRSNFCKLCRHQFKYTCLLVSHKQKWHEAELELFNMDLKFLESQFSCNICEESYATQSALNYHMRKHSKDEKRKPRQCARCSKQFPWSPSRERKIEFHMKNVHKVKMPAGTEKSKSSKLKSFCSLCNRQFRYACLLVTHKKKWHKNEMELYKIDPGKLEATFTCNLCPESFLTQNILNYHTRVKHSLDERKRAQQCSLCEETFEWSNTRKVKMRAHMKNVHGVKNEISSEKKIPKKSKKAPPFVKCSLCYKAYNGSSKKINLNRHHQKVHKDELHLLQKGISKMELQFECSECEFSFVSRISLGSHIKFAHNIPNSIANMKMETLLELQCCNKTFENIVKLNKHKQNVHKR